MVPMAYAIDDHHVDAGPPQSGQAQAPLPDRRCRQCNGAIDGTERPYRISGDLVPLHLRCRRFYLKTT